MNDKYDQFIRYLIMSTDFTDRFKCLHVEKLGFVHIKVA